MCVARSLDSLDRWAKFGGPVIEVTTEVLRLDEPEREWIKERVLYLHGISD